MEKAAAEIAELLRLSMQAAENLADKSDLLPVIIWKEQLRVRFLNDSAKVLEKYKVLGKFIEELQNECHDIHRKLFDIKDIRSREWHVLSEQYADISDRVRVFKGYAISHSSA
jgi:hypothetical protein